MPSEDTYPFKNISFECHDGTKCSIGEEACKKLSPYQAVVGFENFIIFLINKLQIKFLTLLLKKANLAKMNLYV